MKAVSGHGGISFDVQARIPGLKPNDDAVIEAELLPLLGRDRSQGGVLWH